jgi:nicotinate-nucleotide adenylyltransferase
VSLYALKRLNLDQIWWLVSPQNPLKPARGMASLPERMEQARAAARHPRIAVTGIESAFGTLYTADTLRVLKRRFPRAHFVWLMGADNLQQIERWHRWPDIFRQAPVAVLRRPAYAAGRGRGKAAQRFDRAWQPASRSRNLAGQKPPAWMVLDNPLNPLSATGIRKDRRAWPG